MGSMWSARADEAAPEPADASALPAHLKLRGEKLTIGVYRIVYPVGENRFIGLGLDPDRKLKPYLDIFRADNTGCRCYLEDAHRLLSAHDWATQVHTSPCDHTIGLSHSLLARPKQNTSRIYLVDYTKGVFIHMRPDTWEKLQELKPLLLFYLDNYKVESECMQVAYECCIHSIATTFLPVVAASRYTSEFIRAKIKQHVRERLKKPTTGSFHILIQEMMYLYLPNMERDVRKILNQESQ